MHKLLIALLLSQPVIAGTSIDWTRLGYIVATKDGVPIMCHYADGTERESRHVDRKEALECAANHAFFHNSTGSYILQYPDERIDVVIPEVPASDPPAPDPPPVDTLAELDPNTVYFCPADGSGARGTTQEPPGSDQNDGTSPWDALASLSKLGTRAEGTDVRLCEGGVFEDQTLRITYSGDIGDPNRIALAKAQQELYSRGSPGLIDWTIKNTSYLNTHPLVTYAHGQIPGWDVSLIDPVVVGCYKILNGVPRPCMDTLPVCRGNDADPCYDI